MGKWGFKSDSIAKCLTQKRLRDGTKILKISRKNVKL